MRPEAPVIKNIECVTNLDSITDRKARLSASRLGGNFAGRPICSRHEYSRTFKAAGAEIGESLVCLVEWIARGLGDDAHLRDHA